MTRHRTGTRELCAGSSPGYGSTSPIRSRPTKGPRRLRSSSVGGRKDGVVYHVYSTYARGTDLFNTFYQLLDRAPKGRDEENLRNGQWWWRRHDEYANGGK
jgi:predicted dithiol-disulfide oxidoreductase (DUF899 family)